MSYQTRLLPVEEWCRLKGTEAEQVYHYFSKEHTNVMVVEKDKELIATWSLIPYYHAECAWVAEKYRKNPNVLKRLVVGMKKMANEVGVGSVIASATTEETAKLLLHMDGQKLPGEHYVIHFGR
jgi:hypothetical protein